MKKYYEGIIKMLDDNFWRDKYGPFPKTNELKDTAEGIIYLLKTSGEIIDAGDFKRNGKLVILDT